MNRQYQHIILFDGICNLCNGVVQFIIKRDKNATYFFTSLQSESGQSILKEHNLPLDSFDSFIYITKGKIYQKSTAALHIARNLDGLWPALYVFIIIPRPVRDFFYKLVADNRYRLSGKRDSCMMPTPELKRRFL